MRDTRLIMRIVAGIPVLACLMMGLPAPAQQVDIPEPVLVAEQQRIEAIAKAKRPAVAVFAKGGQGGGSGVVVSPDGYALTNYHVVKPAGSWMKCGMADGRIYDAVIVGIDPTGDVALIKLLGRDDFPVAELADSDEVRVGDWCFAIGNPFLLATDLQPTVTFGLVSGVHRYQYPAGTILEYADCIQTDAAINPGNSGGPLFNSQGNLIGINGRGSFEKRGRVNVGVGYAISINQIKHFMGYLRSGRVVDHATLGATVSSDQGRILVTNILENSDAYRRGLRYGDEVLEFGGRTISTVNDFKNVLGIFPKGWRVPISFLHESERIDTFVRLAGVHRQEELEQFTKGVQPSNPAPQPQPPEPKDQEKPEQPSADASKPAGNAPPEHIANMLKPRVGYSNYYFNELNMTRVWQSCVSNGDFAELTGTWTLTGEAAGQGNASIRLTSDSVVAQLPTGAERVDLNADLDTQLAPIGSGGMLVALQQWKQFLLTGPEQFGDVYYLGTTPIPNLPGTFDTLIATRGTIVSHFRFDPANGRLVGLEMYPGDDVDPCEIYFADYRDVDGRMLPFRVQVRLGDATFAEYQWKSIEVSPSGEARP